MCCVNTLPPVLTGSPPTYSLSACNIANNYHSNVQGGRSWRVFVFHSSVLVDKNERTGAGGCRNGANASVCTSVCVYCATRHGRLDTQTSCSVQEQASSGATKQAEIADLLLLKCLTLREAATGRACGVCVSVHDWILLFVEC